MGDFTTDHRRRRYTPHNVPMPPHPRNSSVSSSLYLVEATLRFGSRHIINDSSQNPSPNANTNASVERSNQTMLSQSTLKLHHIGALMYGNAEIYHHPISAMTASAASSFSDEGLAGRPSPTSLPPLPPERAILASMFLALSSANSASSSSPGGSSTL